VIGFAFVFLMILICVFLRNLRLIRFWILTRISRLSSGFAFGLVFKPALFFSVNSVAPCLRGGFWVLVVALLRLCLGRRFSDVKSKTMEPIRSGLRHIMSDFLKTQPQDEAAMLAWPVVCGAEVASRTKAVSFADGLLTVEVPDATWRSQLAAFAPRYLSGFNELVGTIVHEVRFEVRKL